MDLASYGLGDTEELSDDGRDGAGSHQSPTDSPRSYAFCTDQNIDQCTTYVNQELSALGFVPISSTTGKTSSHSHGRGRCVCLINCIYDLLQQHRHDVSLIQQKDGKVQRLSSEITIHRSSQFHLREQLQATEREAAGCAEKERQCNMVNKTLNTQIKALKDELRRARSDHQHRVIQLNHENRKIERELLKVKEKLAQSSQRSSGQLSQLRVLNELDRSDRKRATWAKANGAHEIDLYQKMISQHEHRQQELVTENAELREMLTGIQSEVAVVLQHTRVPGIPETSDASAEVMDTADSDSTPPAGSGTTWGVEQRTPHLPHVGFLQAMEESLLNRWQVLKKELANISTRTAEGHSLSVSSSSTCGGDHVGSTSAGPLSPRSVEIEALRKKMANYEVLLAEKERELETQLDLRLGMEGGKRRGLSVSNVAAAKDRLDADRALISEQRRQLDDERDLLLHVAQEMDRKRDEMNAELAEPFDSALREAHEFLDSSIFAQARSASPPLMSPPLPTASTSITATPSTPPKSSPNVLCMPDTPHNSGYFNGQQYTPAHASLKVAKAQRSIRRTPHNRSGLNVSFAAEASLLASGSFCQSRTSTPPRSPGRPANASTPQRQGFREAFDNGAWTSSPTLPQGRLSASDKQTPPPPFNPTLGPANISWSPSQQLASFVDQSF